MNEGPAGTPPGGPFLCRHPSASYSKACVECPRSTANPGYHAPDHRTRAAGAKQRRTLASSRRAPPAQVCTSRDAKTCDPRRQLSAAGLHRRHSRSVHARVGQCLGPLGKTCWSSDTGFHGPFGGSAVDDLLVRRCWGRYIAILSLPGGSPAIFRDPIGTCQANIVCADCLVIVALTMPRWLLDAAGIRAAPDRKGRRCSDGRRHQPLPATTVTGTMIRYSEMKLRRVLPTAFG